MCRDIDPILKRMESECDLETTRSLLRQADACATCPEQAHTAVGADECSCQVRFRTELQNSLKLFLDES
jgi:hypothetical protein